MHTRLTRKPGQKGTKKLVAEYGDRLICVRYRYDAERQKRYKTVELIVEETPWKPPAKPDRMVWVKVAWGEVEVARQVKQAGGKWSAQQKAWALAYSQVQALGLEARIIGPVEPAPGAHQKGGDQE